MDCTFDVPRGSRLIAQFEEQTENGEIVHFEVLKCNG
jgi:hypothetical protein